MKLQWGKEWILDMEGDTGIYDVSYQEQCILKQQSGDVRFSCEVKEPHPCFTLNLHGKQYYIAERYLAKTGVVNFRDLGGLLNVDGRQVRYDCFYRSAPLCDLNKAQVHYINQLHLRNILDLRSAMEIQGKRDLTFSGAQYHHLSGIAFDQGVQMEGNFDMAELMKKLELSQLLPIMKQVYARLPFDNPAYRFLVETLQKAEVPIVFHCSAGKDRTGFGAALILLLLGVPEQTIMEDYLLSNVYRRDENAKIYAAIEGKRNEMEALMEVQPDYLNASLQAIKERYGSYEEYFKVEYGIDEEERKRLQTRYLYA